MENMESYATRRHVVERELFGKLNLFPLVSPLEIFLFLRITEFFKNSIKTENLTAD
jgi:hypothetical protein